MFLSISLVLALVLPENLVCYLLNLDCRWKFWLFYYYYCTTDFEPDKLLRFNWKFWMKGILGDVCCSLICFSNGVENSMNIQNCYYVFDDMGK